MLRTLSGAAACALLLALSTPAQKVAKFGEPVRLKAAGEAISVEAPGYAAPCWQDTDGDGKMDLVVGQFNEGRMKVYKNLGDGKLGAGSWLKAGNEPASVPGVW